VKQVSWGTILVVDDEPGSLRFLTIALESAGYTALVATSGSAAMDQLTLVIPDLILMDGMMPGLDGFETTTRIKAHAASAHVPVIFMTGLTGSDHVVRAFATGGVDYVRKPVELDELLARVHTHLANGRSAQASLVGLEATGKLMFATDANGHLLWCTALAERALARLEPGWTKTKAALPDALADTVRHLISKRGQQGASVRIERAHMTIEASLAATDSYGEILVTLNVLDPGADADKLSSSLKLTQREAEVLLWVSYGKPNRVIGDILTISPRTVHKHVERIFDKLGVETRSAAAAMAIRSINQ
jgi:DNA-binding NarL/FixJ family response regulator